MTLHRCPHTPPCDVIPIVPNDVFIVPPYSVRDPNALPHYGDLFPPNYNPFSQHDPTTKPPMDQTSCQHL